MAADLQSTISQDDLACRSPITLALAPVLAKVAGHTLG